MSLGPLRLLQSRGLIEPELAERLRRMVGFRNIAVHDYQTIDPRIIEAIVAGPVDDLRTFASTIVAYFEICQR
jgi:uncharacterized protein YutE (UPF0331/DUF86 family)